MYAAIDIGSTSLKVKLFSDLDPDSEVNTQSIPTQNAYRQDIDCLTGYLSKYPIDAIGLAVPGVLDLEKGEVNYHGLKSVAS